MADNLYRAHCRFVVQFWAALVESRAEHWPLCWIESRNVAHA